jgi:signal transduction histidine kinase
MDFQNLLILVSVVVNLFLGFFVLSEGRGKLKNRFFGGIALSVSLWSAGMMLFRSASAVNDSIFWGKILYLAPIFIVVSFLFFSYAFVYKKKKKDFSEKIASVIVITLGLLISYITLFTNKIVNDVLLIPGQEKNIIFGSFYFSYGIFIAFAFALGYFILLFNIKNSSGIFKMQLIYVFIGTFLASTLAMITNLILPSLGFFKLNWIGQVFSVIMTGFIAYAVLKYRLMDIRIAISRTAINIIAVISVALLSWGLFIFAEFFELNLALSAVMIALFSSLVFNKLSLFFEKIASRYLYYNLYSSQKTLKELGEKLSKYIDLEELSELITKTLVDTLNINRAVILLREEETGKFKIIRNIGFREENGISLVQDNFLTEQLLLHGKPIVYEEIFLFSEETKDEEAQEKAKKLLENMKKIEAELCLPLISKNKMTGIIVLGQKVSKNPYSKQDIDLIESLSQQFSVALENAKLHSDVQDLSENLEKKVEEQVGELQTAYKKLQRIDKMKTEFISIVSHQLRTPLSVIKGHLSMVNEGVYDKEPEKKAKILNDVYEANERLIGLVNDVLNASRIQSGRVEISKEKADITEVIKDVVERFSSSAKEKKLELFFQEPEEKIPEINIDTTKIENVLINFIDNAIKYTNEGSIKLSVEKEKDSLLIKIEDSGDGMNQEELEKLFETFSRGGAGKKYWIQGAGLGLYIARQFTELHKGKVWAESEGKGKGSSFYIKLPI